MAVIWRGEDPEHFQKIMGRGGVITSKPKPVQPETKPTEQLTVDDSPIIPLDLRILPIEFWMP
jgi:hypothetical protein